MGCLPSPSRNEAATQPLTGQYNAAQHDSRAEFSGLVNKNMAVIKEKADEPRGLARDALLHGHVQTLPKSSFPISLVGEGAANAVFALRVTGDARVAAEFDGALLRVAKVPALGLPSTYDYLLQQRFYSSVIKPILGSHAVEQNLISLTDSGIIPKLNELLRSVDHERKKKFRGSFVGESSWGFLVEDMRPTDTSTLIEFKPKWLSSSPSAPEGAIRCRQCAKELESLLASTPSKALPAMKPCPLTLGRVTGSQVGSPFRIAPKLEARVQDREHLEIVLQAIAQHEAISNLRTQQDALDSRGPLHASRSDLNFGLAMTLRDCTAFALIPCSKSNANPDSQPTVKLGDFDWKDASVKFEVWQQTEKDLIAGGFYSSDWLLCNGEFYHPPTLCALEWKPRTSANKLEIIVLQDQDAESAQPTKAQTDQLAQLETQYKLHRHTGSVAKLEPLLGEYKMGEQESTRAARKNPFRAVPRNTNVETFEAGGGVS